MSIFQATSRAQLDSALASAKSGDTIELAGGNYGNLTVKNLAFARDVTITSKSTGDPATFGNLEVLNSRHLAFKGIAFDAARAPHSKLVIVNHSEAIHFENDSFTGRVSGGYGTGWGLWTGNSADISLSGSTLAGFRTGTYLMNVTGLEVKDNTISGIALDAMIVGKVHETVISGNSISLHVPVGTKHTDGIQFWNTGENHPSTGITIANNHIETNNTASHGIYMNNPMAEALGGSAYFSDVSITGNTVIGGQVMGIGWGETRGLSISDNTILQAPDLRLASTGRIPVIRVDQNATDVTITGNTTHARPAASGYNWMPQDDVAGWTVSGNRLVPIGASAPSAPAPVPTDPAPAKPAPAPTPTDAAPTDTAPGHDGDGHAGNGHADTFRFDGDKFGKTPDELLVVERTPLHQLHLRRSGLRHGRRQ